MLTSPCHMQNDSLATLMARLEGILGPVPRWMLRNGRYAHRYYTRNGALYEQSRRTVRLLPQALHLYEDNATGLNESQRSVHSISCFYLYRGDTSCYGPSTQV